MKILITGGAGFIGSHLCDALMERGHNLTVVDNLILGRKENISHLLGKVGFEFIEEDLLQTEAMRDIFKDRKFDMVYHLAANSDIQKGGKDPQVDYDLTFNTTYHVLRYLKEFGIRKFFFAWITRFPNVVGERFTHGVIYDFIHKLLKNPAELEVLGNGEQCKPYVYVKDLVAGILYVIDHASDEYNVYMLGSDSRTKVKDIAAMVIEEMGLNAEIKYTGGDRGWVGDVPEFRYDLSKVNTLGWKAAYTSNESVRLAIQKALGK